MDGDEVCNDFLGNDSAVLKCRISAVIALFLAKTMRRARAPTDQYERF